MNQAIDVVLYVLKGVESDAIYDMIQTIPNSSLPTMVLTEVLRVCKRQWLSVTEKLVGHERAKRMEKPLISLTDKRLSLVAGYESVISILLQAQESMRMEKGSFVQTTENWDWIFLSACKNYTNPFFSIELKQFTYFVNSFQSLHLNPNFTDEQLESICDSGDIKIVLKAFAVSTALPLPWSDLAYVRFQGKLIAPPTTEEAAEHPSLEFWVADAVPSWPSSLLSIVSSYAHDLVVFSEGIDLTKELQSLNKKKIQIQVTSICERPFVTRLCVIRKSSVHEVADQINKGPLGSFVKGLYCRHSEEVDLFDYLDSLHRQPVINKWSCPFCLASLHPCHMIPTSKQRLQIKEDYEYPFKNRDSHRLMLLL